MEQWRQHDKILSANGKAALSIVVPHRTVRTYSLIIKRYKDAFCKSAKTKFMAKTNNGGTAKKVTERKAEMPVVKPCKADDVFTLVKQGDKVKIAIGNYQVSKKEFETYGDAEMYVARKPYEILINVCAILIEKGLNDAKEIKKA